MHKTTRRTFTLTTAMALLVARLKPVFAQARAADTEWRYYGGDQGNRRYAPLDQIDATNFNQLEVAWRFKPEVLGGRPEYNYEATPLMVGGKIYTTAGSRRDVVALDAATGNLLWSFYFDEGERGATAPRQLSGHGVSYWSDGKDAYVLYVTPGYHLIALDAGTGKPVPGFGDNGMVDLRLNDDQDMDLIHADIGLHSTPIVCGDTVVVGAAHDSGNVPPHHANVKGYARGFDVRTGRRLWIFHTIPRKGEFGYESWTIPGQAETIGNTGVWAQISYDPQLNLIYLPVELPTGDYNGQYRAGNALFGETIVALDGKTGKRRWHYQTCHHGLWDRDLPCAPVLVDISVKGKPVKALAQPTKQAFLFVLNRVTGKPIWPISEVRVEKGDVPGEWYSPTQPIPSKPPAYDLQGSEIDHLIDFTPELRAQAVQLVSQYKTGPIYTPPVLSKDEGPLATLTVPGTNGGTNWPGGAFDPETQTFYVFSQTTVAAHGMIPNPHNGTVASDFDYVHGLAGATPRQNAPSGSVGRETAQRGGRGGGEGEDAPAPARAAAAPAQRRGLLTIQGLPLLKPPYGRITAIDLSKGDIVWQVAHGETPDNVRNHPALKGLTIPRTGRPGILGPLATKSLVICGESGNFTLPDGRKGAMLRAYDKATGADRGAVYMPAQQTGSPMSYMLGGRQYLVVAIGGTGYSAELLAFRLPQA